MWRRKATNVLVTLVLLFLMCLVSSLAQIWISSEILWKVIISIAVLFVFLVPVFVFLILISIDEEDMEYKIRYEKTKSVKIEVEDFIKENEHNK